MYPLNRNRRLRSSSAIRDLVRENTLSNNDFIVPLFVVEGKNIKKEIFSMPDTVCDSHHKSVHFVARPHHR